MTTGTKAQALALDILGRFAMVQEHIDDAFEGYLRSNLAEGVVNVVTKRIRFSDNERLTVMVALAAALELPLYADAFRDTYSAVKTVRDDLAHGGLVLDARNESNEQVLLLPKSDKLVTYSKRDLSVLDRDCRWLLGVTWRAVSLVTGDEVPARIEEPSAFPPSAVRQTLAPPKGVNPPLCPSGHANTVYVYTAYGEAWLCGHCEHLRAVA